MLANQLKKVSKGIKTKAQNILTKNKKRLVVLSDLALYTGVLLAIVYVFFPNSYADYLLSLIVLLWFFILRIKNYNYKYSIKVGLAFLIGIPLLLSLHLGFKAEQFGNLAYVFLFVGVLQYMNGVIKSESK